ncbi:protein RRP5 homolog [Orussus abietinus]|uniref:protein RRP5 homolog n=1 Tax=Orussus abietinus TaxID=222816 RepID=UPI0006261370|nr:protein RRP5 homolog [Orussus abietinus]
MVQLSTKSKHMECVSNHEIHALDALTPGTSLMLTVKDLLPNGLRVSFGSDNIGFINEIYLGAALSSFSKGTEVCGTLLYVLPILKISYFTLLPKEKEKELLTIGDIFEEAKVIFRMNNGIFMSFPKGHRAFIPVHKTGINLERIESVFKLGSVHKCRILRYSWMDRVYLCSTEKTVLEKKYFSVSELSPGDVLYVKVMKINNESGSVTVASGGIRGIVSPEHVSDPGMKSIKKLQIGSTVKVRVLEIEENKRVQFTMRSSLIESKLPILYNIKDAKIGGQHHGTVIQIHKGGLLVKFFGNVKGWVPREVLNHHTSNVNWNYSLGQVITAKIDIIKKEESKLLLSIIEDSEKRLTDFKIGEIVEGIIVEASTQGVLLQLVKGSHKALGFLPAGHLASCHEIAMLLAARFVPGDILNAFVFSTYPSLMLSQTIVPEANLTNFNELQVGNCIPCSVKEITKSGIKVILPLENFENFGTVLHNNLSDIELVRPYQILLGTVIAVDKMKKSVLLSTALSRAWMNAVKLNTDLTVAIDVLSLYLKKVKELSKQPHYEHKPISMARIGQRVNGKVEKVTESGLVLQLENNLQGLVRKEHYSRSLKAGDKVRGNILWCNYAHEIAEVTLLPTLSNVISADQDKLPKIPIDMQLRGEIVLVTSWFILILLKGQCKGRLVALPARRHLNDLQPDLSPYIIGKKIKCYLAVNKNDSDILPICVLKSACEFPKMALQEANDEVKEDFLNKRDIALKNITDNILNKKIKRTEKNIICTRENIIKEANEDLRDNDENSILFTENKKIKNETLLINQKHDLELTNDENDFKIIKIESRSENTDFEDIDNSQTFERKTEKRKGKHKKDSVIDEGTNNANELRDVKKRKLIQLGSKRYKNVENDNHILNIEKDGIQNGTAEFKGTERTELFIPECGFYWDDTLDISETHKTTSSSSDDEDGMVSTKKKKKFTPHERREEEKQKERAIWVQEENLSADQIANSVDQFDRLVLSSPDSSLIWIQYMTYYLQATEIDKARAVAKRAIKTIHFREENERQNVWYAWLNLESRFGTNESLNDVFQNAIKSNDSLKVYLHMLIVYSNTSQVFELEKVVNILVGKFKENPQVWIECGTALLKIGLKNKSRDLMQRALQSLPAIEYVNLMLRFAQLEFKFGDNEVAQTLFERILSSYPQRVDIWSSYVDALTKSGDIEIARDVLERAVAQVLPMKKMKTIFKKFITFENQHGTSENIGHAKQLAVKYVENQCNKL